MLIHEDYRLGINIYSFIIYIKPYGFKFLIDDLIIVKVNRSI